MIFTAFLAGVIGFGLGMAATGMYVWYLSRKPYRDHKRWLETSREEDREGNWREASAREWQRVVASERREGRLVLEGDEADGREVDLGWPSGLGEIEAQRPFDWEDTDPPPSAWPPPSDRPR